MKVITRAIILLVTMSIAALVVGLTVIEGPKAISEEAGYQPVAEQKQQNEPSQYPVPDIPQYSALS